MEPLELTLARLAGEALARCPGGPGMVDAVVMSSAATRGDVVLTSDIDDLECLRVVFPAVHLLRV